jgi:hypothetical protein
MLVTKDATHIAVFIKGDRNAALRAGHTQGIPLRYVRSTPHGESVCIAEMQFRKDILKWLASSGPRQMPDGSPLMATETYVSPYKTRD